MKKTNDRISKLHIQKCRIYFLLFILLLTGLSILGQETDDMPPDVVPPPIKILSKEEKTTLESQGNNIKKRTKVSLELMDARIERAEKSQVGSDFKQTLDELAGFNAILDNTLSFLIKTDSGRSDRSFINFEIYLRKQIPRLEAIRREMPFKYGYHVGKIMRSVREARSKAVEPIFDDSVIPNASKKP